MTVPSPDPKDLLGGPFRLAAAMVATTMLLILWGAMVTSTGSGMAFVDWPLSDGVLMPSRAVTDLDAFLEHFHRVIASAVGAMMLALTIWVGLRAKDRPNLRRLCITGLGLVVVQGIIGGTGVLKNLPHVNSVTHGVLAQIVLAVFAAIALALTPAWQVRADCPSGKVRTARRMTVAVLVVLLAQLSLGAIARHTGQPHALWTHVGLAFFIFVFLLVVAGFSMAHLGGIPLVRRLARLLLTLLFLQVVLGFTALLVRMGKHPENIRYLWRASLISAHVLVGALLMLVSALLCATVHRCARPVKAAAGA